MLTHSSPGSVHLSGAHVVRLLLVGAALLLGSACGSDGTPDPGSTDPCEQVPTLTCEDVDTCDEVYTASSEDQLRPLCDDDGEFISTSRCSLMQCCYFADGLFGEPSLHCVSEDIDPNYAAYCASRDGTYCPH